jgi:hypothetical protein
MIYDSKLSALFTKNEIDWLISKKKFSRGYERKIKSDIKKKINIFYNYELPLLLHRGFDVTKYCNGVTAHCNMLANIGIPISEKNIHNNYENRHVCYKIQSLGREFQCDSTLLDSRPFPYQGNALPG